MRIGVVVRGRDVLHEALADEAAGSNEVWARCQSLMREM